MHYTIKNILIRSENTAKPFNCTSSALSSWIENNVNVESALDYGCGKLRYTDQLAQKCKILGIVDSQLQLSRLQTIKGQLISVQEYAKNSWPSCNIFTLESFWYNNLLRFEFILCANVLSAIPCTRRRALSLRKIHDVLIPGGEFLVVNQHANSYFKKYSVKQGSIKHMDGWINKINNNEASYYGILNKQKVTLLLKRYGFIIKESWIEGQSNFVLATKR